MTLLLVAIMATLVYAGPALWQTWTHDGPTLVTDGDGTGEVSWRAMTFVAFYSGSQAVFDGNAALVYDENFMKAAQHGLVGESSVGYLAFMYPPTYLLLVSPLALVPYFPALALWLLVPLLFLLLTIGRASTSRRSRCFWRLPPRPWPKPFSPARTDCCSPPFWPAALLLQDRRPVLAGILLGLATAKPQLAILLFPALIFGRQWTVLLGAAGTLAVMIACRPSFSGSDAWSAYAAIPGQAREWLAAGQLPWPRMPTLYAAARLAGLGDGAASLAQAATGWLFWPRWPGFGGAEHRSNCAPPSCWQAYR